MKDYAWKLAERYPNHEKHMSLRDGVEMEVEGHGDRWAWNVRSTTGAYIAKDGKAESLREAKAKAEGMGNAVRVLAYRAYEMAKRKAPDSIYRMDRDRRTDSTIHQIRAANPGLDDDVIDRIAMLKPGHSFTVDLGAGGKTRIERVR